MRYLLLLIISYLYIQANAHLFVYHRFGDDRHKTTDTSIQELRSQFDYFKNNGYEVVKLEQILEKLSKKEKIPDNWVAISIDDAYKSFYENALSVFKEYNYPFSLYVYVKATTKHYGDFMTWDQIRETSKYGTIGLHSYGHPRLTNLSDEEVFTDTKNAYDKFVKEMGYAPKSYAYPYGEYNSRVQNIISKFNFDAILTQTSGSINATSDSQELHRVALVGKVDIKEKLRYITLPSVWLEPLEFPKDGILRRIKAKVDTTQENLKLYITGEGWSDIKAKDGIIDLHLNIYLKNARTRVAIGTDYYNIASKIIIKEKKHVK